MTPAFRLELAHLFAVEAESSNRNPWPSDEVPEPSEEQRRYLRSVALYEGASSPEEAARLLFERGRGRMAVLVHSMGSRPARVMAEELRSKADLVDRGVICHGWFEERDLPRPSQAARESTARALRWAADVFDRYARIQPPDQSHSI